MRFFAAAAVLASAPTVFGQNFTFLSGLLQTLTSTGHNQLASVAAKLNGTAAGQSVLSQLSNGSPFVLFAPTDNALPSNVTSDVDALADVIAYHIASGNFTGVSTTYPNTTLGTTLLNDPKVVQLEASGQPQALAWAARDDGKVHVLNQFNDTTVSNTTTFGDITIYTIDQVLGFPGSLAETVALDNTSLALVTPLLRNVSAPLFNASTNATAPAALFDILNGGLHGFTFFAPNDAAITLALAGGLAGLASNQTAVQAVFQNHTLSFTLNATGHYVSAGGATARIVQPDVLLANGVLHVIDAVLLNTASDAAAASSAGVPAATHTASATGPIGFSATATASNTGASASGTQKSNGARGGKGGHNPKHIIKIALALAGALAGMVVI
ncbi:FAS1 domain-containing protein [Ganoderma leucocontextum]|nr:FAS1 domain-containing protein [Ganoderma leucocontextum]